jgi:hypothetical protein
VSGYFPSSLRDAACVRLLQTSLRPFCALDFKGTSAKILFMPLPSEPVTLSVEQIAELNRKLTDMRHDVNNNVALMLSAIEMIRRRPESTATMLESFARQPRRVLEAVTEFSKALESAIKITRP